MTSAAQRSVSEPCSDIHRDAGNMCNTRDDGANFLERVVYFDFHEYAKHTNESDVNPKRRVNIGNHIGLTLLITMGKSEEPDSSGSTRKIGLKLLIQIV